MTECWHCLLKAITVDWRPSQTYPGAFAGYVHQRAKVAGVFPREGRRWEGKVFLSLDDGMPARMHGSKDDAQEWCGETVRRWFAQFDHA